MQPMILARPGISSATASESRPRRLLLVSHTPLAAAGGASARWRSLARYLPARGWEMDILSAPGGERADPGARSGASRSDGWLRTVRSQIRRFANPLWALVGLKPQPLPTRWVARGAISIRRRLSQGDYDAVLATGPPMSALIAARLGLLGSSTPLLLEFRDLWRGNDAYDAGGAILPVVESWLLRGARATICTSPEALSRLGSGRSAARRVFLVPNGFEPELLERSLPRVAAHRPVRIVHSGALVAGRPLRPLLTALADRLPTEEFELVLQGYLAPEARSDFAAYRGRVKIEVRDTTVWDEAIDTIADADVGLVIQGAEVGDATAIAGKAYEYLALRKPVLCLSTGGSTEWLLRELGVDDFCARLDQPDSITRALRLLARSCHGPRPVPAGLHKYRRDHIAERMAETLNRATAPGDVSRQSHDRCLSC